MFWTFGVHFAFLFVGFTYIQTYIHTYMHTYIHTYEIHCHQSLEHTGMGYKAHHKNKSDWRQSVVTHQPASREHTYGEKPHT